MPPECFGQDPDCSLADHPGHAVSWYSMSLPTFQADYDRITLEFPGFNPQAVAA